MNGRAAGFDRPFFFGALVVGKPASIAGSVDGAKAGEVYSVAGAHGVLWESPFALSSFSRAHFLSGEPVSASPEEALGAIRLLAKRVLVAQSRDLPRLCVLFAEVAEVRR